MPLFSTGSQVRYVPPNMESEAVRAKARQPVTQPQPSHSISERAKRALKGVLRELGVQSGLVASRTPEEKKSALMSAITPSALGLGTVYWTHHPKEAIDLAKAVIPELKDISVPMGRYGAVLMPQKLGAELENAVIYLPRHSEQLFNYMVEGMWRDIPQPLSTAAHEITHVAQRLLGSHPEARYFPFPKIAHELEAWVPAVRSNMASARYASTGLGSYIRDYLTAEERRALVEALSLAKTSEGALKFVLKPALLAQALINAAIKDPRKVMNVLANMHEQWWQQSSSVFGRLMADISPKAVELAGRLGNVMRTQRPLSSPFTPEQIQALNEVIIRMGRHGSTATGPQYLKTLLNLPASQLLSALLLPVRR